MAAAPCCRECGVKFNSRRAGREFCSPSCRRSYNNRRAQRGAILYDAIMAWRFNRSAARAVGLLTFVCRAASSFRAEDDRERDGRSSWDAPHRIRQRHPHISAELIGVNVCGSYIVKRRRGAPKGSAP